MSRSDDPVEALTTKTGEVVGYKCPDCGTAVKTEPKAANHCGGGGDVGEDETEDIPKPEYITDPDFAGDADAVREHYRRVWPVYDALSTVGDGAAITNGGAGDRGWYQYNEHLINIDTLEAGWDAVGRPITFADEDRDALIGKIRGTNDPDGSNRWRVVYNITSWKDPDTMDRSLLRRFDPGEGEDKWEGDERNPLPDYEDVRAMGLWVDLDLADDLKGQRGTIDDETLATVEQAQTAFIEEIASLYGETVTPEDIAAFDSGGGAYLYGPPEASLPIAEHFSDDSNARQRVFDELSDRLNAYGAEEINQRVFERVPDAEGLLDPDWMQNKNRKSKAPLAIHHKHDVVVTPLRNAEGWVDYTPTLVSETEDELITQTVAECERLTAGDHTDAVDALVAALWGEEYAETGGWSEALDTWVEAERQRERDRLHQRALDEQRQRERLDERRQELAERRGVDPSEIAPDEALAGMTVTTIRQDVFDAVDRIDVSEIIREYASDEWNTSSRDHETTFDPNWRDSGSGMSCAVPKGSDTFVDNACDGGGGPAKAYALGKGILTGKDAAAMQLDGKAWGEAIDGLRSEKYDIPVFVPEAGSKDRRGGTCEQTPLWALRDAAVALGVCGSDDFIERESDDGGTYLGFPDAEAFNATLDALDDEGIDHGREHVGSGDEGEYSESGEQYAPETCAPPAYDPEPFDREKRWRELEGDRYEAWVDRERAHIWGDGAGTGKTTNAGRGAAVRDRPHAVKFDKHAKAREFITNDATPDGYFHLKGGEQPLFDCCMDAKVDADEGETPECPSHGHPSEWRRMNPIYELQKDDPIRERYEVLVSVVGPRRALFLIDEEPFVEENPWLEQFERLATAERVVGVHEYQTLKTVLEGESVGERDLILDETPRLLANEHRVSVEDLVRVESRLNDLASTYGREGPNAHNFRAFARFAARVRDAIIDDAPGTLADVDPPALLWDRYETWDPTAGSYIEDVDPEENWQYGDVAAQVKLAYNEAGIRRVQDGTYNGEPFCMDELIGAAAKAGLPDEDLRRAIAIGPTLEDCPWCAATLGFDNGARCCTECGWHERENTVTTKDGEPARATAWLDDDPDDLDRDEEPTLAFKSLPLASDLPDPLVLDATATPEKVAGLYGHDIGDVDLEGNEPLDLEGQLRVTQVVGGRHGGSDRFHVGGQYHAATIRDSEKLRERIQSAIDTAGDLHEHPLFGIRKDLISLFTFPENGKVLHYGGARGLDFDECDAVMCIGAPHPNVDDLRRDAELLAMDRDHDDLRVGGEEYSTRRNAPNPPVYRKLLYEDENGDGLAVPTKGYSGLVGALFREGRECELEQFVHRIRPVLADDLKHAYLLTDVPTDLAVDDVVGLEELADPIGAMLPVSEGAVRLLGHVIDIHEGEGPSGFRAGELVEERGDGSVANKAAGYHRLAKLCGETGTSGDPITQRTVRNWIHELEALGLLTPEGYEQRRGVSYAADPSTSKRALQVLSCNGGFEVALKRRLASLTAESDSGLAWLRHAFDLLTVSGDRCAWSPFGNGGDSRASHGT